MNNQKFILRSLGHALLVLVYTGIVATIMQNNGDRIFGEMNTLLGPISLLMLLVLSAAVVGALVLGRPALMYFAGEKKRLCGFSVILSVGLQVLQ